MGAAASIEVKETKYDEKALKALLGEAYDGHKFAALAQPEGFPPRYFVTAEQLKKELLPAADAAAAGTGEAAAGGGEAAAAAPAALTDGKYVEITMTELPDALNAAVAAGKTPLVVDNSEDHMVDTFFQARDTIMIDAKALGLKLNKKVTEMQDTELANLGEVMDTDLRQKLVRAVKDGRELVVCGQDSVTNFARTFNDAPTEVPEGSTAPDTKDGTLAFFPTEVFQKAGRGLIGQDWLKKLYREDDIASGGIAARKVRDGDKMDQFKVVCTTWFSPEPTAAGPRKFEDFLFKDWGYPKPVDQYQFIIIKHNADVKLRGQ